MLWLKTPRNDLLILNSLSWLKNALQLPCSILVKQDLLFISFLGCVLTKVAISFLEHVVIPIF